MSFNHLFPLRSTVGLAPLCAIALALASSPSNTSAAVIATLAYEQGFEVDTDGWQAFGGGSSLSRVPDGTNGISSADGDFHAEVVVGGFTNFGGYSTAGSELGFLSTLDIYLSVTDGWANDTRVDYSVAASNTSGGHLRDFIFNMGFYDEVSGAGTNNGFIISAGFNSGRANSFPSNPGQDPISITDSGWYTFQHLFQEGADGALEVTMAIVDENGNAMGSWTLSNATDDWSSVFGGNRYGWMLNNEFTFLAIDNSTLTVAPEPGRAMLLSLALLGWLVQSRRRTSRTH